MTELEKRDYHVRTNWDKVLEKARMIQRGFIMQEIPAGITKNESKLEARVIVELDRLTILGVEELVRTDEIILRYDSKKDYISIVKY